MQQETQFDLIVVGGGTAGAFSAIAAAREGLKVAVVERGTCLGGLAASSGLTEMNAAGFQGAPLYRGIEREVFDRLMVYGGAISGVDPAALTCVIGACACVACATPPSTAHAAIAAGSGWLNTDTMLKYGLLWSVTAAVIFAVVGYPIAAAIM